MQENQTKVELQEQLQFNNIETVVEIGDHLSHEFTYEEAECELEVRFYNHFLAVLIFSLLNYIRISLIHKFYFYC